MRHNRKKFFISVWKCIPREKRPGLETDLRLATEKVAEDKRGFISIIYKYPCHYRQSRGKGNIPGIKLSMSQIPVVQFNEKRLRWTLVTVKIAFKKNKAKFLWIKAIIWTDLKEKSPSYNKFEGNIRVLIKAFFFNVENWKYPLSWFYLLMNYITKGRNSTMRKGSKG